jgi:hypothetical protein
MVVDTFGIILGIAVVLYLIIMVAARVRKESMKETVSHYAEWIKEKLT